MKVERNFIYLSTEDSAFPEILINLWDFQTGKMKELGGLKGLLETAIDTLDSTFPDFEYFGIVGEEELEDDSTLA
jgi:hypothetical protein